MGTAIVMWTALALASAAGGLTAMLIWYVAVVMRQQSTRRIYERLRQLGAAPSVSTAGGVMTREDPYGQLPGLRRLMAALPTTANIVLFLEQAGSRMTVSAFLLLHLCCGLIGLIIASWWRLPWALSVLVVLGSLVMPLPVMAFKRRIRFNRLTEQLPDAVRLMASALRAGLGLDAGLEIAASELPDPIGAELVKLMNEWRLHSSMDVAFGHLADRVPTTDIRLFAASARLHREIGGNFADLLDQLERTIRDRIELYRELKTLTAESRLSGWILGALPLLVGIGIFGLNPSYAALLLADEAGRFMLWAAVVLQGIGFGVIRILTTPRFS